MENELRNYAEGALILSIILSLLYKFCKLTYRKYETNIQNLKIIVLIFSIYPIFVVTKFNQLYPQKIIPCLIIFCLSMPPYFLRYFILLKLNNIKIPLPSVDRSEFYSPIISFCNFISRILMIYIIEAISYYNFNIVLIIICLTFVLTECINLFSGIILENLDEYIDIKNYVRKIIFLYFIFAKGLKSTINIFISLSMVNWISSRSKMNGTFGIEGKDASHRTQIDIYQSFDFTMSLLVGGHSNIFPVEQISRTFSSISSMIGYYLLVIVASNIIEFRFIFIRNRKS